MVAPGRFRTGPLHPRSQPLPSFLGAGGDENFVESHETARDSKLEGMFGGQDQDGPLGIIGTWALSFCLSRGRSWTVFRIGRSQFEGRRCRKECEPRYRATSTCFRHKGKPERWPHLQYLLASLEAFSAHPARTGECENLADLKRNATWELTGGAFGIGDSTQDIRSAFGADIQAAGTGRASAPRPAQSKGAASATPFFFGKTQTCI